MVPLKNSMKLNSSLEVTLYLEAVDLGGYIVFLKISVPEYLF